jgi:hypothetical protein
MISRNFSGISSLLRSEILYRCGFAARYQGVPFEPFQENLQTLECEPGLLFEECDVRIGQTPEHMRLP